MLHKPDCADPAELDQRAYRQREALLTRVLAMLPRMLTKCDPDTAVAVLADLYKAHMGQPKAGPGAQDYLRQMIADIEAGETQQD